MVYSRISITFTTKTTTLFCQQDVIKQWKLPFQHVVGYMQPQSSRGIPGYPVTGLLVGHFKCIGGFSLSFVVPKIVCTLNHHTPYQYLTEACPTDVFITWNFKKNSIGEFLRAQYAGSKSEFKQVTVIVIIHNMKITLQCSAGKLWFLVLTLTLLQNKHTLTALVSGSIGQHALQYCKTCSGMVQGS